MKTSTSLRVALLATFALGSAALTGCAGAMPEAPRSAPQVDASTGPCFLVDDRGHTFVSETEYGPWREVAIRAPGSATSYVAPPAASIASR